MGLRSATALLLASLSGCVVGQECSQRPASATLPELITFGFEASSTEYLDGFGSECADTIAKKAKTSDGTLAILQEEYSGGCFNRPDYAHSNYTVERGTFVSTAGDRFAAYRVHRYKTAAKRFMAGKQIIYMSVPPDQVVYAVVGGVPMPAEDALLCKNPASCLGRTKENLTSTAVVAWEIKEPTVLFTAPRTLRLSTFPLISDTVAGAWLAGSALGYGIEARIFPVPSSTRPRDPTRDDVMGPHTHSATYEHPRRFYSVTRADGKEGVVWTEALDAKKVWMTWFALDLTSSSTSLLYTPGGAEKVYAVTHNGVDSIVLIIGVNAPNKASDKKDLGLFRVVQLDSMTGKERKRHEVHDLNIWGTFSCGGAAVWDTSANSIAFTAARLMPAGGDGLNHQAGVAVLLDATSLEKIKSWGISSHSWSNTIVQMQNRTGSEFIAADLGDNYPRGLNVHRVTAGGTPKKSSKVLYTYKTQHSKAKADGSCVHYGKDFGEPYYTSGGQTFCKHSNDNRVYTELARPGIVVAPTGGFLVFFAGEQPALDNTRIGSQLNGARDIGFVKVSDDLQEIMSEGKEETGGFYTFGGSWKEQSHKGVNFITSYNQSSTDEVATRIKTFQLSPERFFLTFEVWGATGQGIDYKRTELMELDMNGSVIRDRWTSCWPLRQFLNNEVFVIGGKGVVYAGHAEGLMRYEICVGNDCYTSDATSTTTTVSQEGTGSPPVAHVAVTLFTTKVSVMTAAGFSESSYIESVAAAAGVKPASVEVVRVAFVTTARYKFAEAVTADDVQTAVADALRLNKTDVEVTLAGVRRLHAARRLAVVADVKVRTTRTSDTLGFIASLNDTSSLSSSLSRVTGQTISVPEVMSAPAVVVEVDTKLLSDTDEAVSAPEPSAVAEGLPGTSIVVEEVDEFKVVVDSTTQTTTSAGDAETSAASMHTLPVMVLFSCVALGVRKTTEH
eukprot:TRINITY_DN91383_c0_g1_i1.p1 TRINITY_DN91383_c0_g1~~TRINITY_DN91383_c0_g1_i1.p1  ORF type:complete len:955 (-),score=119.55 TRINITY_DN91383_c0_g1_i1:326-3190(-)